MKTENMTFKNIWVNADIPTILEALLSVYSYNSQCYNNTDNDWFYIFPINWM